MVSKNMADRENIKPLKKYPALVIGIPLSSKNKGYIAQKMTDKKHSRIPKEVL